MDSRSTSARLGYAIWIRLLALYPKGFRAAHGQEILDLLAARWRTVRSERGRLAAQRFWWRNSLDLLHGIVFERQAERLWMLRNASERTRDVGGADRPSRWFEEGLADLRIGARRLRRSPGFTAVAVLLLALGIGANSSIFAVLYTVVLKPMPFPAAERLVDVYESNPERGWDLSTFSHPNYLDHRDRATAFDGLAAFTDTSFNLELDGPTQQLSAGLVTHEFYDVLGVNPILGRTFTAEEDTYGRPRDVVLVGNAFWRDQLGGRRDVVGTTLRLDGEARTVVGVLPAGTFVLDTWQVVAPLQPNPDQHRDDHRLNVLGRIAEDHTLEQAEADLDRIAADLEQQHPATNAGFDVRVLSLHDSLVREPIRDGLALLMGAVLFVLLIAITNLANLLLVRTARRQREFAVSLALGSGRGRILRQVATEAILLAVFGGAVGLALSAACLRSLRTADLGLPRLDELSMGVAILVFTGVVTIVTGLLATALPAFSLLRGSLRNALHGAGRDPAAGGGARVRRTLVIAEVAISTVLLIGAGLLLRSFWEARGQDPGFRTEGVLTASLNVPPGRFAPNTETLSEDQQRELRRNRRVAFFTETAEALGSLPAVESVALTSGLPFGRGATTMNFRLEGQPREPGTGPQGGWRIVSPDYFRTMGIELLRGRAFDGRDTAESPGRVIVGRRLADDFWPGEDPIGKRLYPWDRETDPVEIVGVVADVRERHPETEASHMIYLPLAEFPFWSPMHVVARTTDPAAATPSVRAALGRIAPDLALANAGPLNDLFAHSLAPRRFQSTLLAAFAALALILAAIGIYGVVSSTVAQQQAEIGVRLAMGASPRRVGRLVLRRTGTWIAIGTTIGLISALALGRVLEGLLYGVTASDPLTLVAAVALLGMTAMAATLEPAWRASRTDPLRSLRAH